VLIERLQISGKSNDPKAAALQDQDGTNRKGRWIEMELDLKSQVVKKAL
jgi:hypothetical protein